MTEPTPPLPDLPAGWVRTDRSRTAARWAALAHHPVRFVRRALRPRRGISTTVTPPTGADEVLERLAALPLSVWTYGFDDASVRHLGPMAQDFAAAFGLGDSDRRIDLVDANGVTMAAIQALHRRVVALEAQLAAAAPEARRDVGAQ